ncbi:hypothetical protein AVEN_51052-1, partial [Araneus ventricosus]
YLLGAPELINIRWDNQLLADPGHHYRISMRMRLC